MPGAWVEIVASDGQIYRTKTDSKGYFYFAAIPAGPAEITVNKGSWPTSTVAFDMPSYTGVSITADMGTAEIQSDNIPQAIEDLIARRYMLRLRRDDFEDPHELARFAATAHMSLEEFRKQFEHLVHSEPPPLALRPERDVLRIERVFLGVRDDRLRPQLPPMNAVARDKRHQPGLQRACERLEPLDGRHAGALVQEGREIVAERRLVQDNVVRPRAIDLAYPEVRLGPMNSVPALTITGNFARVSVVARAPSVAGVKPKEFTVFNNGAVFEVVGRFGHGRAQLWLVQPEFRA